VVFVESNVQLLNQLCHAVLTLIFLVQAIFSFVHRYFIAFVGESGWLLICGSSLYQHLVSFSLRFYSDNRTGEIVSRVTNDVTMLAGRGDRNPGQPATTNPDP
jgi:subfamily B ATP-binding cassette protein MsbA